MRAAGQQKSADSWRKNAEESWWKVDDQKTIHVGKESRHRFGESRSTNNGCYTRWGRLSSEASERLTCWITAAKSSWQFFKIEKLQYGIETDTDPQIRRCEIRTGIYFFQADLGSRTPALIFEGVTIFWLNCNSLSIGSNVFLYGTCSEIKWFSILWNLWPKHC